MHSKAVLSSVRWRQESPLYRVLYWEMHLLLCCVYWENLTECISKFWLWEGDSSSIAPGIDLTGREGMKKRQTCRSTEKLRLGGPEKLQSLGRLGCKQREQLQWIFFTHRINICTWTRGMLSRASEPHLGKVLPHPWVWGIGLWHICAHVNNITFTQNLTLSQQDRILAVYFFYHIMLCNIYLPFIPFIYFLKASWGLLLDLLWQYPSILGL